MNTANSACNNLKFPFFRLQTLKKALLFWKKFRKPPKPIQNNTLPPLAKFLVAPLDICKSDPKTINKRSNTMYRKSREENFRWPLFHLFLIFHQWWQVNKHSTLKDCIFGQCTVNYCRMHGKLSLNPIHQNEIPYLKKNRKIRLKTKW